MLVESPQVHAMFHSLVELNRKFAIQRALREDAIKTHGGLPCPYCRTPMTLVSWQVWKWTCKCSSGIRFHES